MVCTNTCLMQTLLNSTHQRLIRVQVTDETHAIFTRAHKMNPCKSHNGWSFGLQQALAIITAVRVKLQYQWGSTSGRSVGPKDGTPINFDLQLWMMAFPVNVKLACLLDQDFGKLLARQADSVGLCVWRVMLPLNLQCANTVAIYHMYM